MHQHVHETPHPAETHDKRFRVTRSQLVAAYRKWEEDCREHPDHFKPAEECRSADLQSEAESMADALLRYLGK